MSEEQAEQTEERTYTPEEERAISNNWMPKEDWVEAGHPEDDWVDAKTFNRNGEFMGRISAQTRKIQNLEHQLDKMAGTFKSLNEQAKEEGRKQAIAELRKERAEAYEEGDLKRVSKIEDKIDEIREQPIENEEGDKPSGNPAEEYFLTTWLPENNWYSQDEDMQIYFNGYMQKHGAKMNEEGLGIGEALNRAKEATQAKFKKSNPNRDKQTVASSNRTTRSSSGKKFTWNDLDDDQKQVGDRLIRLGAFDKDGKKGTRQDFIDRLAKSGELK